MSNTSYDEVSVIEREHSDFSAGEKENYDQLCRKSIAEHIRQATGAYGGTEVSIDSRVETFIADISYSFSGDVEFAVLSDRLPPSSEHSLAGTRDEFTVRLASQKDNDLSDVELRRKIEASLARNHYGEIYEETVLYENPMSWLFYQPCQECGGRGSRTCTSCRGHGSTQCFKCKGSGQIRCQWCNGTGRKQPYNSSLPDYHKPCTYCNGTGIEQCNICKGRGHEICSKCHGHGEIRCEHCAGSGWLTTIARTHIKVKPAFSMSCLKTAPKTFKDAVSKIGLVNIRNYAEVKYDASERDSADDFIVHYVCRLPLAEAEVSIKGKKSKWLLCGKNASVLDAGGAMDNIMEDVISAMQKSKPSLLRPYADVSSSIADFMSYDVNKKILSESIESDNPRTIQARLKNAVSEQYISDALKTLTLLCKNVQSINSIYFAVMFAILTPVLAYLSSPIFQKVKPESSPEFFGFMLFLAVCVAVPAISAWLIVKVLNKWYKKDGKELFYDWRKKKKLLMRIPFTENKSVMNGYSLGEAASYVAWSTATALPGIATYIWALLKIV